MQRRRVEGEATRRGQRLATRRGDVAVRIDVVRDGAETEIGDGGFTDWTGRLLADGKERCLTSCISTERLASLRPELRR